MDDRVTAHFQESIAVKQASQSLVPNVALAADVMATALLEDGKILSCGNGGHSGNLRAGIRTRNDLY
jgi:D-sedoheptulose 7-phosphate isomerase